MFWKILSDKPINSDEQLLNQVLANRQINDRESFLNPPSCINFSTDELKINKNQLRKAVKRIQKAIINQEKVLIYGDYDADGITATSILWLTLNELGLVTRPFIPDRIKHGYGISQVALEEILSHEKPDLIITVDNGIVANEPLAWAASQGVEVIVTDHHQPSANTPVTTALVHSTLVSGATVAWILARELNPQKVEKLLDLVAVSAIADQMPLTGVNRSFVTEGLKILQVAARPGIHALCEVAGVDYKTTDVGTIGFVLAPRINAAGRISQGMMAVRLLCTQQIASAKKIAQKLNNLNRERQDLTSLQLEEAEKAVESQKDNKILIVSSANFHEGIIGLIAGRLTEKYSKPSIAIASEGQICKASARSVAGVNITDLIRNVETELLSIGGHELAAGFSAYTSNLSVISDKLIKLANDSIEPDLLTPLVTIDGVLGFEMIREQTINQLNKLKPFGIGNLEPILALMKVKVLDFKQIGQDKQHLKLRLRGDDNDYESIDAVGWRMGDRISQLKPGKIIDLAFNLEMNRWNGKSLVQLKLKDFRLSE